MVSLWDRLSIVLGASQMRLLAFYLLELINKRHVSGYIMPLPILKWIPPRIVYSLTVNKQENTQFHQCLNSAFVNKQDLVLLQNQPCRREMMWFRINLKFSGKKSSKKARCRWILFSFTTVESFGRSEKVLSAPLKLRVRFWGRMEFEEERWRDKLYPLLTYSS